MPAQSDDILITSGCQQAFDLLAARAGSQWRDGADRRSGVPGLRNVFQRAGARLIGIPVGRTGSIWKRWRALSTGNARG